MAFIVMLRTYFCNIPLRGDMQKTPRLGEGLDHDLQKRIGVVRAREAAAGVKQGMQDVVTGGQTPEGVRCGAGTSQETEASCARR